jgi:hypothetical protein
MSIAATKLAEVLALPEEDRAYLAHELIASLEQEEDTAAEGEWEKVIDQRTREMAQGRVDERPEGDLIREIKAKINAARRQAS